MPRVNAVKKAQKAQGTCGRCGTEINVGDAYVWIKFRRGGRFVRCTSLKCHFRPSDLTQSKMSGVYSAQENAEDNIGGCSSVADLKALAEETADAIEEVAEEYQESADNIRDTFSESATADDCEEKAEGLLDWVETFRSALDDFNDEFEPAEPDAVLCPECGVDMKQNDKGTWDCTSPKDEDCGVTSYSPKDDSEVDLVDDEGRTEEEWLGAARQALEDVLCDCPL